MSWRKGAYKDTLFIEHLIRDDDGKKLGTIMRFYEDGTTYAHLPEQRLGAFSTDAEARLAVEEARKAFDVLGSGLR